MRESIRRAQSAVSYALRPSRPIQARQHHRVTFRLRDGSNFREYADAAIGANIIASDCAEWHEHLTRNRIDGYGVITWCRRNVL